MESRTLTTIIACLTAVFFLSYCVLLLWCFTVYARNRKPVNQVTSALIRRYAPAVFMFLFSIALVELALSTWLLVQWHYHGNYPNLGARIAARTLLFTSCWTVLICGAQNILSFHPTYSGHILLSMGALIIWQTVSWIFWVTGSSILLHHSRTLFSRGECRGVVVYCGQLQALFALSVVEILVLSSVLTTLVWIVLSSSKRLHRISLRPLSLRVKTQT